jgi:hypothetical protein
MDKMDGVDIVPPEAARYNPVIVGWVIIYHWRSCRHGSSR